MSVLFWRAFDFVQPQEGQGMEHGHAGRRESVVEGRKDGCAANPNNLIYPVCPNLSTQRSELSGLMSAEPAAGLPGQCVGTLLC